MKPYSIALSFMLLLTGCVTTKQNTEPPKPFVEPSTWTNATEFAEFKSGLFYIDKPETAVYLKDRGAYKLAGLTPMQQLTLKGIDILQFSPFRTCYQTIEGRLEDTIVRYCFLETSREKTDEKVVEYENAYGAKRNVMHSEYTAEGMYFENTGEKDYLHQQTLYQTTPGLVVENGDFQLILKRADAEVAGKDAVVRIYFTLNMDKPAIDYLDDSDVGLSYLKGFARAYGETFKSKTHYTLHNARLLGVKIIYTGNIFSPNPTAIVE